MSDSAKNPQVYSKHMVKKHVQEHLTNFNNLLTEMMGSSESKPGALDDVRVIETSHANFPGIIASSMLGELGAEVIKIEPPDGDQARKISPYGVNLNGIGLPFLIESRNKYNIVLDLSHEAELEKFRKLVEQADVLIDVLEPGYMDNLGIGYRQLRELKPSLIYVAVSPYGHYTKKAEAHKKIPDTDLTAQSASGYPAITGDPDAPEPYNYPLKAGIWTATYMSAALCVAGILTALLYRNKTGEGQMVDIATNDAISAWQGFSTVWGFTNEMPRTRVGNFDWCLFPYGYYEAKDGYVTVAAASDADFRGLLKILGRWDLEEDWRNLFDRLTTDVEVLRELEKELKKEIAKYSRAELLKKTLLYSAKAARDRLRSKGYPLIVETREPREVLKDKHWQIRQTFLEVDDQPGRKVKIPAPVPKMSESPLKVKWLKPGLDEDKEAITKKYKL